MRGIDWVAFKETIEQTTEGKKETAEWVNERKKGRGKKEEEEK